MAIARDDFPSLGDGYDYARGEGLGPMVLVGVVNATSSAVEALLQKSDVEALALADTTAELRAAYGDRMGRYWPARNRWILPRRSAPTVVFGGSRDGLGLPMIVATAKAGVRTIVYWNLLQWAHASVASLAAEQIIARSRQLFWNRVWTPIVAGLEKLGRRFRDDRDAVIEQANKRGAARTGVLVWVEDCLIGTAARRVLDHPLLPMLPAEAFAANRAVLVNVGLAAGGAERQIVNTLTGLKERGFDDVSMLADRLEPQSLNGFFVSHLAMADIEASVCKFRDLRSLGVDQAAFRQLESIASRLPDRLRSQCVKLIGELLVRRPQVVHAWQDESSIVAALAAAIVGVPIIVLSSRNVSPINFGYHHYYMRPFYRVLSRLPNVRLSNNSAAGASDYVQWLRLGIEDIRVLRNGFNAPPSGVIGSAATAFPADVSIPVTNPVVGSIFRFFPEKRGTLWLRVAAEIAEHRPDVHFLLIGDGVERARLEHDVAALGLGERVHFAGEQPHAVDGLALMNVFLLTSRFEGLPNVLLEAQAFGVPVVATDAGGVRETFVDGESGWLMQSSEPCVIAERVLWILEHPQWASHATAAGKKFIATEFGMARMVDETVRLYGWAGHRESIATGEVDARP